MLRSEARERRRSEVRARARRAAYDSRLRELAHDMVVEYDGVVAAGRVLALVFQADRLLRSEDVTPEDRLTEVEQVVHRRLLHDVAARASLEGPA